jgi:hypothetical protein
MRALLVMKRQITWQERELNIHSQDLNQLAASQLDLLRKRTGTGQTEIKKKLVILNQTYAKDLLKLNSRQLR